MMDWGNTGWGAGEWAAMSTVMILFWGGLIALGFRAVRNVTERSQAQADRSDTLLAERFARGEIDGEEFTRSRELLRTRGFGPVA